MALGLEVFDGSGTNILSVTTRLTRLIGTYSVTFPAGTSTTYGGYSLWPYTYTCTSTILSSDYGELAGMTKADGTWGVVSVTPNATATLVDVAGSGRIIVRLNRNTDPRISNSATVSVFRY